MAMNFGGGGAPFNPSSCKARISARMLFKEVCVRLPLLFQAKQGWAVEVSSPSLNLPSYWKVEASAQS